MNHGQIWKEGDGHMSQGQNHFEKTIIPIIESVYDNFTPLERNIADFFIHNTNKIDFSSKNISNHLFVSEASLSRFAKKCGFKGYREFIFHYESSFTEGGKNIDDLTKSVLNTYQELLNKSFALVDEEQMHRISKMLTQRNRVFVYGKGSSGLVAQEIKLRFMRLGLDVEAIVDSHIMKMNSVLVNEKCLVIAVSISGKTSETISSLKAAKKNGASTLLISSYKNEELAGICDEILLIPVLKNLELGNMISPQFPILVMVDIFYSYFLNTDLFNKSAKLSTTLTALYEEQKRELN